MAKKIDRGATNFNVSKSVDKLYMTLLRQVAKKSTDIIISYLPPELTAVLRATGVTDEVIAEQLAQFTAKGLEPMKAEIDVFANSLDNSIATGISKGSMKTTETIMRYLPKDVQDKFKAAGLSNEEISKQLEAFATSGLNQSIRTGKVDFESLDNSFAGTISNIFDRVEKQNSREWMKAGFGINLYNPEIEAQLIQAKAEQLPLIKTIPQRASIRVEELAVNGMLNGERPMTLAQKILETNDVSRATADRIAMTELGRANSMFMQTRAKEVGLERYIWRTLKDKAVRPSHQEMEGKQCLFSEAPTLSDGRQVHPGEDIRCRCFMEPIF